MQPVNTFSCADCDYFSNFQRFVTKSFAPSLSLYFVKRRLLLPHLQPFPPLWGTFAPYQHIENEFAILLYEGM